MDSSRNEPLRFANLPKWKAFATVVVTVVTLASPFFLFRADLRSHSLSLRLTSSVPFQVAATSAVPDVQVLIGGVPLEKPYMSTLILTNDGLKPIVASDFEYPLEIAASGAEIERAGISKTDPTDLKGMVSVDEQGLKLKPLLLNAGDSIQFSIITSGKRPIFSPRSRIAGVSKIVMEDETKKEVSWQNGIIYLMIWLVSLVMYPIFAFGVISPAAIRTPRAISIAGAFLGAWVAASPNYRVFEWFAIERTYSLTVGVAVLFVIPIMGFLSIREIRQLLAVRAARSTSMSFP
jgi:hypothetical protein